MRASTVKSKNKLKPLHTEKIWCLKRPLRTLQTLHVVSVTVFSSIIKYFEASAKQVFKEASPQKRLQKIVKYECWCCPGIRVMKALRTLQKFPDTFVPLGLQPSFPILSMMTPDFAKELNLHIIFMK